MCQALIISQLMIALSCLPADRRALLQAWTLGAGPSIDDKQDCLAMAS